MELIERIEKYNWDHNYFAIKLPKVKKITGKRKEKRKK